MTVQPGLCRKPERWFSHDTSHLVVFSDGSQCGFRRIMSMFLNRPNFLKLTHVDIYTSVFSRSSLFCDKVHVCDDFWIRKEKKVCLTLKNGLSDYMHLPRNGSM